MSSCAKGLVLEDRRSEGASELGPEHQKLACISWDSSLKGRLEGDAVGSDCVGQFQRLLNDLDPNGN